MRITFVANKLDMGGGGSNYSLNLMVRSLARRGHNLSILTMEPTENDLPADRPFEILTPSASRFGTRLGTLDKVYRSLVDHLETTDLYHVFTPAFLPAAGRFRKRDDSIPVIGRLNTYTGFCVNMARMDGECHRNCNIRAKFSHYDGSLPKRIAKLPFFASRTHIEPRYMASLDEYFAISPAVKEIYSDVGIPRNRIEVIPNFYDPDFGEMRDSQTGHEEEDDSKPRPLEGTNNSSNRLTALYVGHLKEYKGVDIFLEALATVDGWDGIIVGDGSAMENLVEQAERLGVAERVSFEGWVDHDRLPAYYRGADVLVHPARLPEPFGRTILESLQCGTPAIVSDLGGPPWIVGEAGIEFARENHGELADVLERLHRDPETLAELAEHCESRLAEFAPERVLDRIETRYEELTTTARE